MALLNEVLVVSGVALDLLGAGILSHAHNAESIVELREEVADEGSAVGEPDALATHAQLLAEKRVGFLLLTVGLTVYLCGLVLKSPEGVATMAPIAVGVVVLGLVGSLGLIRLTKLRVYERALRAREQEDPDALPEQ
ncbi:MAG: hypothetical protein U0R80_00740 [Nocardioidaceae bacterium]